MTDQLQRNLDDFFRGRRQQRRPKYRKVCCYPDGKGVWWFRADAGSTYQKDAIEQVHEQGGWIEKEPVDP